MTWKATEIENKVLKPCSVCMAVGVYVHCYLYPTEKSMEKLQLKIEGEGGLGSDFYRNF